QVTLVGIDRNEKLIENCRAIAKSLGMEESIRFSNLEAENIPTEAEGRFNAIIALHACDTATDHAISYSIKNNADFVAVAPCCQAELANYWRALPKERQKN